MNELQRMIEERQIEDQMHKINRLNAQIHSLRIQLKLAIVMMSVMIIGAVILI